MKQYTTMCSFFVQRNGTYETFIRTVSYCFFVQRNMYVCTVSSYEETVHTYRLVCTISLYEEAVHMIVSLCFCTNYFFIQRKVCAKKYRIASLAGVKFGKFTLTKFR